MSKEFPNRIKELRKAKGYTQKDFADLIGIGQTTVANYERGIRVPDTEKLDKIASLFGVTVDFLLGRQVKETSTNKDLIKQSVFINSIEEAYSAFLHHLLDGDKKSAKNMINRLYEDNVNISTIYLSVLEKALKEVGLLWETGRIDVWQEHFISETVLDIMREIKVREKEKPDKAYSILAFTAGPELHNIGLRMITDLLELDGWRAVYLGSNVPVKSVINAIELERPNIIAVSVTMPYHIETLKHTLEAIKVHFSRKSPKIIVGGPAFLNCSDVCFETGADYYGINVEDIKKLVHE